MSRHPALVTVALINRKYVSVVAGPCRRSFAGVMLMTGRSSRYWMRPGKDGVIERDSLFPAVDSTGLFKYLPLHRL